MSIKEHELDQFMQYLRNNNVAIIRDGRAFKIAPEDLARLIGWTPPKSEGEQLLEAFDDAAQEYNRGHTWVVDENIARCAYGEARYALEQYILKLEEGRVNPGLPPDTR